MGLFNFIGDWKRRLIDQPIDARMTETLKVGLQVARSEVHVISGHLRDSIGGEYNRSTKTILLHADAKYALIEETRGPTRSYSQHHYLAPAAQAMGAVWGGKFELHFPHAAIGKAPPGNPLANIRRQEVRLHSSLGGGRGGLASRTRIYSRRWHKRAGLIPQDPMTPLV